MESSVISHVPVTLADAISSEPFWLQIWVGILMLVHLLAIAFVLTRVNGRWRIRYQPVAIFLSFLLAGAFMTWLYDQVGYVRLLGVAHLLFWTPVFVWVWRTRYGEPGSVYTTYLVAYLAIAGLSLVVDAIDLVRYLLGDGALL